MNRALCVGGARFRLGLGGFMFLAAAFCAGLAFTRGLGLPLTLSALSLLLSAFTLFARGLGLPLLLSALPLRPSAAFTLLMLAG